MDNKHYCNDDLLYVIYNHLLPIYNNQTETKTTLDDLIKKAKKAKLPILLRENVQNTSKNNK